jgi:anti-sigma factor ChrR (cupin superfamily)
LTLDSHQDYQLKKILPEEEVMADVASQIIRVNDIEWSPMAPMIKAKVLWSDPATKRRAQLTRFEPGAALPMHRHVGDELLYVLEGAISDEHGTTTSGNVGYRPDGCVHSVNCKNGATVLAIVTGGVEPATDRASAPPSQNFTLSEIPWTEAMTGVQQKAIWQDQATKRRAVFVRFAPGAQLPRHKHVGDELIFVIEGSNADESGEVVAGNMNYRPNGCVHSVSTKNGATVLAVVTGGVEMMK